MTTIITVLTAVMKLVHRSLIGGLLTLVLIQLDRLIKVLVSYRVNVRIRLGLHLRYGQHPSDAAVTS